MFDFPLWVPQGTEYDLLGVAPEATSREINEAKAELVLRLRADQAAAKRKLEAVCEALPGLRSVELRVEELRGGAASADPEELGLRLKELAQLEQRASALDPGFRGHREKIAELQRQIEAVNRVSLHGSDERLAYDRRHPPLELLKLPDCTLDEFTTNRRLALSLIRSELSRFLARTGEEVFHPSDLTRQDFSRDFTPNPLLDGSEP